MLLCRRCSSPTSSGAGLASQASSGANPLPSGLRPRWYATSAPGAASFLFPIPCSAGLAATAGPGCTLPDELAPAAEFRSAADQRGLGASVAGCRGAVMAENWRSGAERSSAAAARGGCCSARHSPAAIAQRCLLAEQSQLIGHRKRSNGSVPKGALYLRQYTRTRITAGQAEQEQLGSASKLHMVSNTALELSPSAPAAANKAASTL